MKSAAERVVESIWAFIPTCVHCGGGGRSFNPVTKEWNRCLSCGGTGATVNKADLVEKISTEIDPLITVAEEMLTNYDFAIAFVDSGAELPDSVKKARRRWQTTIDRAKGDVK